jgi:WD40 repeat protein
MPRPLLVAALLAVLLSPAVVRSAPFVPSREAQAVAITLDGKLAATAKSGMSNSEFPPRPHPSPNKCGVIEIWEVGTGKRLHRMESFGDMTRLEFSPDGRLLAASRLFRTDDGTELNLVRLINVADGAVARDFNRCRGFCFSPDGRELVVLSHAKCVVFDTAGWRKQREIETLGGALSVEFSPRGDLLSGVLSADGMFSLSVCDAREGTQLARSRELKGAFYTAKFSPDGRYLATGHDGGLVLWDVSAPETAGLQPISQFKTGSPGIEHPFFSPDGLILAAGNQQNGEVIMWESDTGKELRRFSFDRGSFHTYIRRAADEVIRPEDDPARFVFTPDGSSFLAGCQGGVIRTVSSGQELRRLDQ